MTVVVLKRTHCVLASKPPQRDPPPHHSAARTDVVLLIRRTPCAPEVPSGAFFGCGLAGNRFEPPFPFLFRLCPA